MFTSIRNRWILIAVLALGSVYSLRPRDVTVRVRGPDGRMRDTTQERSGLKLGLDLQGGMHLALEIDQSKGTVANPEDALDRALTVIRSRVDEFGVGEPLIQKVGKSRIIVELPGIDDPARAKSVVERSAFLEFRITDTKDEFRTVIPAIDRALERAGVTLPGATPGEAKPVQPTGLEGLLEADSSASDSAGTADSVAQAAADSLDPTRPGIFSSLLYQGSLPGEYMVPEEDFPFADSLIHLPEVQQLLPRGIELFWSLEPFSEGARPFRGLYALQSKPLITGDMLSDARAQLDPLFNQAVVNFELTRRGGRIFGRETARHIGDYMAILLDGRVQDRPPVIRSQIRQKGQIELGNASLQDAQDLALVLRAGALPAPLHIVEERTVGPSLGHDSIAQGEMAGAIGAILVILIMAFYYRKVGLLAIAGLAFYVLFTLGGLASFAATLTLPGLAGFVLSIGIAVDANVLIFERIREELALNKTVRAAIDTGFERAMPAIIDANITTVITAAFLFQFGTGPVKGFAVTLIVGIIASLITAVFVTRTFFMMWLQRRPTMPELSI